MKYIVWVGGVGVFVTLSKKEAKAVAKEWTDENYDDVIIEEVAK